MKNILFLFALTLFIGCGPSKAELEAEVRKALDEAQGDTTTSTPETISTDKSQIKVERVIQIIKPDGKGGGTLRFIEVDGHAYLQWYTAGDGSSDVSVSMLHDENCTNEIHNK